MPWSPEVAREMARKGGAAFAAAMARRRALALLPPASALNPAVADAFAQGQLSSVRTMLTTLDARLAKVLDDPAPDPETVERLCRSSKALSEREAYLAGRPRPGIRRPPSAREEASAPLPPPRVPTD